MSISLIEVYFISALAQFTTSGAGVNCTKSCICTELELKRARFKKAKHPTGGSVLFQGNLRPKFNTLAEVLQ